MDRDEAVLRSIRQRALMDEGVWQGGGGFRYSAEKDGLRVMHPKRDEVVLSWEDPEASATIDAIYDEYHRGDADTGSGLKPGEYTEKKIAEASKDEVPGAGTNRRMDENTADPGEVARVKSKVSAEPGTMSRVSSKVSVEPGDLAPDKRQAAIVSALKELGIEED